MFILMLLISPMSHKTHFGILIFPGFFVARAVIQHHDRFAAVCLLIGLISIGLLDHFPIYPDLIAWFGNITIGTLALGFACGHLLMKNSRDHLTPAA
jgi:hypothetical protein